MTSVSGSKKEYYRKQGSKVWVKVGDQVRCSTIWRVYDYGDQPVYDIHLIPGYSRTSIGGNYVHACTEKDFLNDPDPKDLVPFPNYDEHGLRSP